MKIIQNDIFVLYLNIALFLAAVFIYFVIALFRKEKKFRKLQEEKLKAEVIGAEFERNKIATDLHNDIGPYLSSVKMRLDILQTNNQVEIDECKQVIDQCILQIRSIAQSLSPLNIFDISFEEALRQYIQKINVKNAIKISLIIKDEIKMSPDNNNHIYRMLQEVIQNTIKHAQASTLHIEISKEEDMMLIRTGDNGVGYDMKEVRKDKKLGLGILGILTRVELLRGTISQSPAIEKGTKYNIRIPIGIYE